MSTNDLSPPGTSTYSSNTLHVGDGTWDNGRDSFLLPNLVGLNFATMQYNGMGNRFRNLPEYHRLIIGHGILAAMTFLIILPTAVFAAKFGIGGRRETSRKVHSYCQVLVIIFSTIVLILGWFAVGPRRSLSNPHHGIGVAIYVLIWAQFLFGYCVFRREKKRQDSRAEKRIPFGIWIHGLTVRFIALLGIVQIPLGLTLYGSPKYLFILYALVAALLLFSYIGLDRYYFESRRLSDGDEYYSEYGSYLSGSRTQLTGDSRRRPVQEKKKESHWGRNLLAAGGALGVYEAWKHRRMRKREEKEQAEMDRERGHTRLDSASYGPSTNMSTDRPHSRPSSAGDTGYERDHRPSSGRRDPSRPRRNDEFSTQSWENEKYDRPHTWRDRILGAAGGIAALEGARRLFGRKKKEDSYQNDYRPPLGGNQSYVTQTDVSRVQNGQAPFSPGTPGGRVRPDPSTMTPSRPSRLAHSQADTMTDDEDDDYVSPAKKPRQDESHTLRNSIATFGAIAGFREWNNRRRERRERERTDRQRREELANEENFNRRTSNNYPRPQDAGHGRRGSYSETLMTGATGPGDAAYSNSHADSGRPGGRPPAPNTLQPPLPAIAGEVSPAYDGHMSHNLHTSGPSEPTHTIASQDLSNVYSIPPPPPGPPLGQARPAHYQPPIPGSAQMPVGAVNPDPSRLLSQDRLVTEGAAIGGTAAALAASSATGPRRQSPSPSPYRNRPNRRGSQGTAASPGYSGAPVNDRTQSASSPPISLKMQVHNDGRHVTLRRLNEEEAAAERAARRPDRNTRYGRTPSLSSAAGESSIAPSARYPRTRPIRQSSDQPIVNVPPPPPMSSSAGRPSEVNLPGRPAATASPSSHRPSPRPPTSTTNVASELSGGFGSPGNAGTESDVNQFAEARRRRRAERARRLEAARGTGNGGGNRVEFE